MILFYLQTSTMNASQYWVFAQEYSIWNAAVAALQCWIEDLEPHVLSHVIDWVYAAFFYSGHAHQVWNLPEEILFSHFVNTLNDVFEIELIQEDEGYERGSENFHIQTPLSRALRVYHVSTVDDLSFNPANFDQSPTTAEHHAESSSHRYRSCSLTCHQLVFTSLDDESPMRSNECCSQCSRSDDRGWDPREIDISSSVHHSLCHCVTPTRDQFLTDAWLDDTISFDEHFPTAPLDDDS